MAGAMLEVETGMEGLADELSALAQRLGNLDTPLRDIGEYLMLSTDTRYTRQITPEGTPWAPLSPVTLARKKDTRILRETGVLQDTLHYQVEGNELLFGSNQVYAAVHQKGQRQGASGRTSRGGPIPWGDIPARPYLGLSLEDQGEIMRIIESYALG